MAQQIKLDVAPREATGKSNKRLRREGLIPANIYGHKQDSTPIQIDAVAFEHLRRQHGTRSILTLVLPDIADETAIVRHVQRDPVTGHILHVDFARVQLRERLETKVPLNFVGTAPGVKVQGGVLIHLVEAIAVECEAGDIVEGLDVDISHLEVIDDIFYARDVKLPARFTLVTDPNEPVAKIEAPRVEEVAEVAAEPAPAPGTPAAPANEA